MSNHSNNQKNSKVISYMKTIKSILASSSVLLFIACGGKDQQQAPAQQAPSLKVSTLEKQDITLFDSYSTNIQGVQNV